MNYFKKNLMHFYNFFDYIAEHLLCILLILIILILSGVLLAHIPPNNPESVESQQILIFGVSLENWGIWYTAIGLIIGAIWSIYQFTKSVARKQQEKGASIAKDFNSGLLDKCGLVTVVFKNSILYKILNSHEEYNSFRNFTISELRDIYGNDLPAIYRDLEADANLNKIYHDILEARISLPKVSKEDSNSSKNALPIEQKENKQDNEVSEQMQISSNIREIFILDNKNLPFRFSSLIDDVLNELEYLCMDISSQAAGSKYIYQSLHQIFFRTIKVLSVEICLRNDGKYCDKYYTNIIHVYNEWTKQYERDLKKELKRKKEVDRILNPKIKTV